MTQERDALDQFLAVGASFDWITPVLSLLSGDVHIFVDRDDQNYANAALDGVSIKRHRPQILGDWYTFDVARTDADEARKELAAAGIVAGSRS
jgi:hypothetical protein